MRRRGFTMVEIMIVVMIIGLLMMIAVPQWMKARQTSRETTCKENRRVINDMKQLWAQDEGHDGNSVPSDADLLPYYLKVPPKCPENGTYALNAVDVPSECSVHGTD